MKRILVLEDAPCRVEWLRTIVGVDVEIIHCEDVASFNEALCKAPKRANFDLVILDHDLGHVKPGERRLNWDSHGYNGVDAARLLCPEETPLALVWSVNSAGAPHMVRILRDAGIASAWVPYYDKVNLEATIRKILT